VKAGSTEVEWLIWNEFKRLKMIQEPGFAWSQLAVIYKQHLNSLSQIRQLKNHPTQALNDHWQFDFQGSGTKTCFNSYKLPFHSLWYAHKVFKVSANLSEIIYNCNRHVTQTKIVK
jgi:hypothetical protein